MIFDDEILKLDISPFYEKWKRGRPSKEQLKKRELHHEWFKQRIKKYPHKYPMLSFLMSDTPHNTLIWKRR